MLEEGGDYDSIVVEEQYEETENETEENIIQNDTEEIIFEEGESENGTDN